MPDLGKRVNYEFLYKLDIKDPTSDAPVGVTIMIRSAASEEARRTARRHADTNIDRRIKGKGLKAEALERQELEKAASYVASWNWGDNTYNGQVPAFTIDKVIEVLDAEPWILQQVMEAANDVTNFSPTSVNGSPPTST